MDVRISSLARSYRLPCVLCALLCCMMFPLTALPQREPGGTPPAVIMTVTTATDSVLVISFTDGGEPHKLPMHPLETVSDQWTVNGRHPIAIHHAAGAVDEEPKTRTGAYPVTIGYKIYLTLGEQFVTGSEYVITGPFGTTTWQFDDRETFCESIKVNQEGYHPDSSVRFAVFGAFLGSGGSIRLPEPPDFRVIDQSGNTVIQGTADYLGFDGPGLRVSDGTIASSEVSSGEFIYRLDLAALPEGGPYRISIPHMGVSYPFDLLHETVAHIASTYARGLYHQRCGIALEAAYTPFTREICHTEVGLTRVPWTASETITVDPRTPMIPISGGYHDAGDFDRRPYHTIIPIMLLSYYEAFPDHFIDGQYSLPESGNGIPDILDEALWGIRSWEMLQITDPRDREVGGIMAGTETSGHPAYGITAADTDTSVYGTWAVSPEVTAFGAGMMAQAARLLSRYSDQQDRVDELMERSLAAWSYLERVKTDSGLSYAETPSTAVMYAALQLFLAGTGDVERYAVRASRYINQILIDDSVGWPEQYRPGNIGAACQTVHFISILLEDGRSRAASETWDGIREVLQKMIISQAETGSHLSELPDTSYYPRGVSRSYGWGAATAQGRYADVHAFAYRLLDDPREQARQFAILSQYGDYALGLNPLNRSFVTGLGDAPPRSPLHLDSWFTKSGVGRDEGPLGNVPGILIFGPSEGRSGAAYQQVVSDTLYPRWEDMPLERRWVDGWSLVNNAEFSVWETMVWNVCLYGVLYDAGSAVPSEGR